MTISWHLADPAKKHEYIFQIFEFDNTCIKISINYYSVAYKKLNLIKIITTCNENSSVTCVKLRGLKRIVASSIIRTDGHLTTDVMPSFSTAMSPYGIVC